MELGYRVLRADTDVYFAEVRLRSSPLILFTLCFILCRSAPPAIDSKRRMVPGLAHLSLACPGVIGAVLLVAAVALANDFCAILQTASHLSQACFRKMLRHQVQSAQEPSIPAIAWIIRSVQEKSFSISVELWLCRK